MADAVGADAVGVPAPSVDQGCGRCPAPHSRPGPACGRGLSGKARPN